MHAVVLTWNGAHLLPDCLSALRRQRAPARVHVVVVDNASTDGTGSLLATSFPEVEHLVLGENTGYARGNNEAMRRALDAGADYVALINNDVEVAPDWLGLLLEAAHSHREAGLFTGTLLFRDEDVVNSTGLVIDRFGRARDRDFGVPLANLRRTDGPVPGVSGGAALLRASMLREIGLFDPAYFAYYEDVDLSLRAARAGYSCRYVRPATARHRFGATFGADSPARRYLLGIGHLRTVARHQPFPRAVPLIALTILYRALVKAPLELFRRKPAIAWAELRAAAAGGLAALRAFSGR